MIRFLILATIIFCFNSSAYSAENTTGKKANTTDQTTHNSSNKIEKISEQISSATNKPVSGIKRNTQTEEIKNQEKEQNKSPDESWWHKLKSDPVATFTALLFFATIALFVATRQLVLGAEKTAQQQLRAYVFLQLHSFITKDSSGRLHIPIGWKNFGNTPAFDLSAFWKINICKIPLEAELDLPTFLETASKSPLAPTEQIRQDITFDRPLTEREEFSICDGNAAVFVHGALAYTDAFGKSQKTSFCLYSTGDEYRKNQLTYYHKGNDAT